MPLAQVMTQQLLKRIRLQVGGPWSTESGILRSAVQLSSATSIDRPGLDFGGHQGVAGLQRSMTPGIASYYTNANSGQPGGFSQANAALPNGFPNGLLSGTGLLNGKQSSGNGIHRLW